MGASVHATQLPALSVRACPPRAVRPAPSLKSHAEPQAHPDARRTFHEPRGPPETDEERARGPCSLTLMEGPMQEDDVTPGNPAPHSHTQGKAGSDLHTHALRSHAHMRAYGTWLLAPALARTLSCSWWRAGAVEAEPGKGEMPSVLSCFSAENAARSRI